MLLANLIAYEKYRRVETRSLDNACLFVFITPEGWSRGSQNSPTDTHGLGLVLKVGNSNEKRTSTQFQQ